MIAPLSRLLVAFPPPGDTQDLPQTAIASDVILLIMLVVGVFLTLLLIGFFAFVIWYESKRSGTKPGTADSNQPER